MILWEAFDKNELSILIMNIIAYSVFFLLPKKFSREVTALFLLWGYTIGIFFDFTIGGGLIDYYKLNDSNQYGVNDLFYYFTFAPFGYFFIYLYESFKINPRTIIWYVLIWSLFGVGLQWIFTLVDIVSFKNGYKLFYSFPVFILTQTMTFLYYQLVKERLNALKFAKK
ncbi:hypothetical protein MUO14_19375 [Halobacillus shinanisalinarum]|uniref:Rod shape-determining protein MreD n=1 Tax=Halobacillus shinanisalinarum TaxID=2932258 RepID=A0ABY4GY11_9BACI|nr:hypothetical protein [Halobacillus shinanisalinarum]UOQ92585.1 hypothetical protein MUO14_19375 [Halobacillus shinanisalinarum]